MKRRCVENGAWNIKKLVTPINRTTCQKPHLQGSHHVVRCLGLCCAILSCRISRTLPEYNTWPYSFFSSFVMNRRTSPSMLALVAGEKDSTLTQTPWLPPRTTPLCSHSKGVMYGFLLARCSCTRWLRFVMDRLSHRAPSTLHA